MPVVTIPPQYHLNILVPHGATSGIMRMISGGVRVKIESEHPVDVYIVDRNGLAAFEAGRAFDNFYTARATHIDQFVSIPLPIDVPYVVISNPGPQPAAVYYEAT